MIVQKGVKSELKSLKEGKGYENDLYDFIIFDRTKDTIGGNVRVMISAGAPLTKDVREFLTICFSADIINAYGLTESCGATASVRINDN